MGANKSGIRLWKGKKKIYYVGDRWLIKDGISTGGL